jgi:hypothetical protein
MRRIVTAVTLGVLAVGLTATAALAGSPQVKKAREPNCLLARSASGKPVPCRAVLVGLAAQANVDVNSNRLPYDEFGLTANQPSQPRIGGTAIPTTGPAVTGLGTQTSVSNDGNRLPYDEFGLAANQPSQPQIGSGGPGN